MWYPKFTVNIIITNTSKKMHGEVSSTMNFVQSLGLTFTLIDRTPSCRIRMESGPPKRQDGLCVNFKDDMGQPRKNSGCVVGTL